MLELKKNDQNILEIWIDVGDKKGMNVIDENFITEFEKVINKVITDEQAQGLILSSKRDEFIAGGDLEMLRNISSAKECLEMTNRLHKVLRKMETWGKPVVAALNGTTLGGGYEVALACHHRILLNKKGTKVGLPEVTLGLLPGGGGTQRLPRMIGFQAALPLLTQGKTLSPEKALESGLVEEVVGDEKELMTKARDFIKSHPESTQPWDQKKFKLPGGEVQSPKGYQVFPAASAMLTEKTHGNYLAPKNILSAVYEGLQVPLDRALEIEARYFTELVINPSSKNMIRTLFYSINECKKGANRPKGIEKRRPKKVGILGAGMMGQGIAYVTAKAGIPVILKDISVENAGKGKAYSEKLLDKAISRGRMNEKKKKEILELITPTADPKDMEGCDLVIEAVIEDRKLKAKVTQESEAVMEKDGIFASNTSTLPITGLSEASSRPDKFIGLHFFSPVDKMPLVEIILGKNSGDEAVAMCLDYVNLIKKTPIVVNDGRGFYTSRVFTTYITEGIRLLTEGINPALIENAGKQFGMPVGPLSVADEVSIDLIYHILKQTIDDLGEEAVDKETWKVADKFVNELGRLGRKSKKGFYEYPENAKKYLSPTLTELFPPKKNQPEISEVKDRLALIQVVETMKCMEDGVLMTARDADVGSILGWGFPAWTGGVLSYVDLCGPENVLHRLQGFSKSYGSRFNVPETLSNIVKGGKKGFYDL